MHTSLHTIYYLHMSLESFKPAVPRAEQIQARYNATEIADQLERYSSRYEEELEKAKAGQEFDHEYLTNAKDTLTDFKNSFDLKIGTLLPKNREMYEEVKNFKSRIEAVLNKNTH